MTNPAVYGLRPYAFDHGPPALCDQVVDKALNSNVLQHDDAENAVIVLTAFFVRQFPNRADSTVCALVAGYARPRRYWRVGNFAAAVPDSAKAAQVAVFAAGVFSLTAVFIHHD